MGTEERIREIVCEIVNIGEAEIDPDASFMEEYGLDSLRALEILATIENEFAIIIDPEKLPEMKTLNGVINVTMNAMKADN